MSANGNGNGNGTLNPKQQRFVEEYLKDLNATRAYSRTYDVIGPTAEVNGCRLLSNAKVQHAVAKAAEQRAKDAGVTVERVLKELVRMAWVDISEAYTETGALKSIHEIPEDVRRAIVSIETDEIWETVEYQEPQAKGGSLTRERKELIGYTKKVKFADKRGSNELLGKYLKMFVEKHEFGFTDDLLEVLQKGRQRVANAR
jgi:phage terminase small subunit